MAGHLKISPFLKSYDELQRTRNRMQAYLDINDGILTLEMRLAIEKMIRATDKAIEQIPLEYHLTKHQYTKKDE